ncbi:MAG TPA: transcriptional regulator NrdR [Myxococcota bacterium]|nr:transcriptional regulator NrdR [Myxococcota bacterium]
MRCPECGAQDTRVVDSRDTGDAVRRRRECAECAVRFTTHERIEHRQLWVVKRDGRKEPFLRDKILAGITHACRKRPFDAEAREGLVDRVVRRLEEHREPAIPSSLVGETVMQVLREVDEVAYVRFASVYRAFDGVEQFIEAIAPLQGEPA